MGGPVLLLPPFSRTRQPANLCVLGTNQASQDRLSRLTHASSLRQESCVRTVEQILRCRVATMDQSLRPFRVVHANVCVRDGQSRELLGQRVSRADPSHTQQYSPIQIG